MTESKMRKTIKAVAAAATLLVIVLFGFLVGQWIKISTQNKRIAAAEARVEALENENEAKEDDLDVRMSEYYKTWAALKLGYVWENNK